VRITAGSEEMPARCIFFSLFFFLGKAAGRQASIGTYSLTIHYSAARRGRGCLDAIHAELSRVFAQRTVWAAAGVGVWNNMHAVERIGMLATYGLGKAGKAGKIPKEEEEKKKEVLVGICRIREDGNLVV